MGQWQHSHFYSSVKTSLNVKAHCKCKEYLIAFAKKESKSRVGWISIQSWNGYAHRLENCHQYMKRDLNWLPNQLTLEKTMGPKLGLIHNLKVGLWSRQRLGSGLNQAVKPFLEGLVLRSSPGWSLHNLFELGLARLKQFPNRLRIIGLSKPV